MIGVSIDLVSSNTGRCLEAPHFVDLHAVVADSLRYPLQNVLREVLG